MIDNTPQLAVFGDSLTEGYGLAREEALPSVMESLLRNERVPVQALNFGVSGDTSYDGLRRLNWVLNAEPDAVVIEFGANDFFTGEPVALVKKNIITLVRTFKDLGVPVLLVGIKTISDIPPEYRREFDPIYNEVSKALDIPLFPDILQPYFGNPSLTLMDGLHPNVEGVRAMAKALLPLVRKLLGNIERPVAGAQ